MPFGVMMRGESGKRSPLMVLVSKPVSAAWSDRMKRMIARVIVGGLVLALPACSNAIDILCPPAGQCPDTVAGHTSGS
jgi:hypothetical protein